MTAVEPDAASHAAQRREIIRRYGRLDKNDQPTFCQAPRAELDDLADVGLSQERRPVIYDTVEQARAAADEMEALDGVKQYVRDCHRSRRGHVHLTVQPPPR